MIFIMYNFIFDFFFKISLIYVLENLFILFYTFYISYEFSRVFGGRFCLIYYLNILFCNFVIMSDIEYSFYFFLKEDLFVKELLYFCINNF